MGQNYLSKMLLIILGGAFCFSCNQPVHFANGAVQAAAPTKSESILPSTHHSGDDTLSPESADSFPQEPEELVSYSVEQVFPASIVSKTEMKFASEEKITEQKISVTMLPPTKEVFQQVNRPAETELFHQGQTGKFFDENFSIAATRLLDLLIVIDDSGSMNDEQEELSSRFSPLISYLQDVDWRIGVVTTSDSCIRNGHIISKQDVDPEEAFRSAIMAGVNGDMTERGIKMAILGLKGVCENEIKPWVRPNSTVAVLIVSDEDNCSTDYTGEQSACKKDPEGGLSSHLINYLASIRPNFVTYNQISKNPAKSRVYGLFRERYDPACEGTNGGHPEEYLHAIEGTQGIYGSICKPDFTPTLSKISQDVALLTVSEITLKAIPDANSLKVWIDGQAIDSTKYELNGSLVRFKGIDLTSVKEAKCSYSVGAAPVFKEFYINRLPASDSLKVEVRLNGTLIATGPFVIEPTGDSSGKKARIVFELPPPETAVVLVDYREDIPLSKSFTLAAQDILIDTFKVEVNGVNAHNAVWHSETNSVVFDNPPPDHAVINVSYQRELDYVTNYQMIPDGEKARTIVAADPETGAPLSFSLLGNMLVFNLNEIKDKNAIQVTYDFGLNHDYSFALPGELIEGSISFEEPDGTPANCGDDLAINESHEDGTWATFSCKTDIPVLAVNYRYIVEKFKTFTLMKPVPLTAEWQVWVDRTPVAMENFLVDESTVTILDSRMRWNSIVRIKAGWYAPAEED